MAAYKIFAQQFPSTIESNDKSWIHQPIFYNSNFMRKYPGRGKKSIHLTPTFYGLDDKFHILTVNDFYVSMKIKTHDQLKNLTSKTLTPIQYGCLKVTSQTI